MNKFSSSLLSLLVMAFLFVSTSCKDDDVPSNEPSITLEGAQGESSTVDPGTAVSFDVVVNMPAGLDVLEITKEGGVAEEPVVITGTEGETSHRHPFSFSPSIEEAGETIVFDFVATGTDGTEVSKTYSITVTTPPISNYETVVIGDRFNKQIGHFYSMLDNQVYHLEDAQQYPERVDFMFYYNEEKQFTITAPSDAYADIIYPESIQLEGMDNQTFFALSEANFASISEPEDIIEAWNAAKTKAEEANGIGPLTVIHGIEVGDVIAFQLDESRGSRYGIAEVAALSDPTDPKTRTVTLHIKITMEEQQ